MTIIEERAIPNERRTFDPSDRAWEFADFLKHVIAHEERQMTISRVRHARSPRSLRIDEGLSEDRAIEDDFLRSFRHYEACRARRSARISCFARSSSSASSSSVMPLSTNR